MRTAKSIPRAELRHTIDLSFPLDSELWAFFIDYFPEVNRQCSTTMDRTTRINLLLQSVPLDQIEVALRAHSRKALPLEREASEPLGEGQEIDPARHDLTEKLAALYKEREILIELGQATADVEAAILELRRRLRQSPQLQPGEFLGGGRYRLLARIGRGGFATVWLATDCRQPKAERVAVKVLHSDLAVDPTHVERFYRGANRMAQLRHPGVVRVLAPPDEEQGYHFFVMEHLAGGDLQRAVIEAKLSTHAALQAVLQAGAALQHAHEHGLIHRDVKPGNILLDTTNNGQLTDFDLVLAGDTTGGTRTGALGTFLYAAPEEMEDARQVDARSDVYSLGMTLAFVLYGRRLPQQAITDRRVFLDQLSCDMRLRLVIERAISPEPADRFPKVANLCEELEQAISGRAMEPAVPLRQAPKTVAVRRSTAFHDRRIWRAVSGMIVAAVLSGLVLYLRSTAGFHAAPRDDDPAVAVASSARVAGAVPMPAAPAPNLLSASASKPSAARLPSPTRLAETGTAARAKGSDAAKPERRTIQGPGRRTLPGPVPSSGHDESDPLVRNEKNENNDSANERKKSEPPTVPDRPQRKITEEDLAVH